MNVPPHTQDTKQRYPLRLMVVLCALMGFASISTDFFLPALPTMAHILNAGSGTMELTITGYLVGFSLGQLFWGPMGDRFGRKAPIAVGLVLFIIGSAGCAMASSAVQIIAWRVVQASGACAGVVLSRAMVRDLFGPERAGHMLSTLMTVMAIAPLVGPLLGGQILLLSGWRAIFWLLVAVGALTGLGLATIPETLPSEKRARTSASSIGSDYLMLLRDRRVLSCALTGGSFFMGTYAYIAGSPFAFISFHHVSAQAYGVIFALGIVGIMLGNQANVRLLPTFGGVVLMRWGSVGAALSGVVMGLSAWSGWGGLWVLVLACFAFVTSQGLLVANSMARAMAHRPQHAGSVSAILGAAQYGSGMLGSALVSYLADGTSWPMAFVIMLSGVLTFLAAHLQKQGGDGAH